MCPMWGAAYGMGIINGDGRGQMVSVIVWGGLGWSGVSNCIHGVGRETPGSCEVKVNAPGNRELWLFAYICHCFGQTICTVYCTLCIKLNEHYDYTWYCIPMRANGIERRMLKEGVDWTGKAFLNRFHKRIYSLSHMSRQHNGYGLHYNVGLCV